MTTLVIARHGNTFGPNDTPTRVGALTDLPLVKKGIAQAQALGRHLKNEGLTPDVVYSSTLIRTKDTAQYALGEMGVSLPIYALDIFNEIDYGPDENKPEADVIARLGKKSIEDWDFKAIIPDGWNANPQDIIENWQRFAHQASKTHNTLTDELMDISETVLVVTSNGIARFAPHITEDFESFAQEYPLKLSTGAFGILKYSQNKWQVCAWNIKPSLDI